MYNTLPISNQKTRSFRAGLYIRLSREDGDKEDIVNYGIAIAHMNSILKRSLEIFPSVLSRLD